MASIPLAGNPAVRSRVGPPFRILLLHHTHWDREWWTTYQDLRVKLVEVVDELIDALDADPEFGSFLLDGQTVVLRDYLEVRPEMRERLVRNIRSGRIQCGPWYVLGDEFLVSGEAHIRNLLLGRRVAGEMDCPILNLGYLPDTFGHVGQMPQILRGFGIEYAFLWRGRGGRADSVRQEFLWEAPNESAVTTHWFPDGYYQMPFQYWWTADRPYEDRQGRLHRLLDHLTGWAKTDVVLLPYGGDHRAIDRDLRSKIQEANAEIAARGSIEWASLPDYVEAIREQAPELEAIRGELRAFGPDHPHLLPGVLSSRLYLKQLNFRGQTWLERYAEPLSALAWLHGGRYDSGLLWKAWDLLVQNHPHDSICGCSIDQVHREMVPRFDQSYQIARVLTERSVQHVNDGIDTSWAAPGDRVLVVHNSLPWTRSGSASVWLERSQIGPRTHQLLDAEGNELAFQVEPVAGWQPRTDRWEATAVTFAAQAVPGMGYRTYRLTERPIPHDPKEMFFTAVQPTARRKGSRWLTDLSVGTNTIENDLLRVEVDPANGTLTVTDRASGAVYSGLNAFEDGGDAGDTYNYSRPLNDTVLRSSGSCRAHVSVAEAGYARATLRVDLDWALPEELADDRLSRSSRYLDTRITSFVSLAAASPLVEVTAEWDNRCRDRRFRALFPLGSAVERSHARSPFEIVERPSAPAEDGRGWDEVPASALPNQGWVAVQSGGRGLLIANRGLPEFEVVPDGRGTVALTLLRAVGWLSREDLLSRIGGAGPTVPVPGAQCPGYGRASYAIVPFSGGWLESGAARAAEDYLVPLYGSATGVHAGDLEPSHGALELEGDPGLAFSACKKSERGDALIVRVWNMAGVPSEGRVSPAFRPVAVRRVDLAEEVTADGGIEIAPDGSFLVTVAAYEIVTLAVFPFEQAEGAVEV